MPELSLPAIGFGTSQNTDPDECVESIAEALDMGYRHVDTAQMYDNEEYVGEGIRRSDVDRDEVVLATKIHPSNLAYDDVIETASESVDRLGVDRVDLLYVHWPMQAYDPEETLSAFDELHDRGVMDHVGVSNFTPDLLDQALDLLDAPIAAHQVELHPLLPQRELQELAAEHDHYLVGYAPLGRQEFFDDDTLNEVAEKHDTTVAQVCLAWEMAQPNVVPIPKARGDHIAENFAARDLALDDDDVSKIDGIGREHRVIDPDGAPWN